MPQGYELFGNKDEHNQQKRGAQSVNQGTLNKTVFAYFFYFGQLQLQNLDIGFVKVIDFLIFQTQWLHQLYVPKCFRGWASQGLCLFDDCILRPLDAPWNVKSRNS